MSTKFIAPSGFAENLPNEQIKEEEWKSIIRKIYESYGYIPLETSSVEYLETLSTKADINKEIYTIGRALSEGEIEKSDRALRYDLTVPFARFVGEHFNDLKFPYKRYQIQKVWRGEKAQKARSREFYQADYDVINIDELPLSYDVEVIFIFQKLLEKLNFGDFTIRVNNRKFLIGLLISFDISDNYQDLVLRILDKTPKVPLDATISRLVDEAKMKESKAKELLNVVNNEVKIGDVSIFLQKITDSNEILHEGKEEISYLFKFLKSFNFKKGKIVWDIKIIRGFDYYTGMVFEPTLDGFEKYGSIGSGGRYGNLAGKFINKTLPGVGGSFGLTRVLEILKLEKKEIFSTNTKLDLMIALFGESQRMEAFEIAEKLRDKGLNVDVFHKGDANIGKQIANIDKKGIPFVLFINEDNTFDIKELKSGEQHKYRNLEEVSEFLLKART